jgi:hypothetical protein
MRSTRKSKLSLAFTGLLPGVLLACLAVPVSAQAGTESQPARGVVAQYDAAHEVTISGTVQKVVTKRTVGRPAGMHLLVSGSNGMVDAHVGPFLSNDAREALHMGLPLQIVGAMETIRGKQYLLARQLMYGGQTLTVRSSNGMLLRPAQSSAYPRHQRIERSRLTGGAR